MIACIYSDKSNQKPKPIQVPALEHHQYWTCPKKHMYWTAVQGVELVLGDEKNAYIYI